MHLSDEQENAVGRRTGAVAAEREIGREGRNGLRRACRRGFGL